MLGHARGRRWAIFPGLLGGYHGENDRKSGSSSGGSNNIEVADRATVGRTGLMDCEGIENGKNKGQIW